MVSDKAKGKNKASQSNMVSTVQLSRKFIIMRKSIQNCNGRIHHLKRRLHSVTKEVKALKKAGESQLKTVKKAERIDRKLDAEKTKLKRKVLNAAAGSKPHKESRKENTSTSA